MSRQSDRITRVKKFKEIDTVFSRVARVARINSEAANKKVDDT